MPVGCSLASTALYSDQPTATVRDYTLYRPFTLYRIQWLVMIYTLYAFNSMDLLYALWTTCPLDLLNSSCVLVKGTGEGPYTLFQVRWQSLWLSSVWAPGLGRGQSLCAGSSAQMGMGFCRGFWITCGQQLFTCCSWVIHMCATC